ncbi:putative membrane protein [Pseudomonas fluorescens]|uniref:Putative membrane protein n=1 Tax=Pseudomonas fluorescens TaxID=294 RepID=A0A0P8XMH7_PSEFL|nr:putative membrane protein [Pseudomonas fluorescens]
MAGCWETCLLPVYISVAAVTATNGSAFTAGHFGKAPK